MQPVSTTARSYDPTTVALHWITALLVAEQWLGAQVIDWFPRGPLRVDARSVHVVLGVGLALVLAGRLLWRATRGRRLPPADRGVLNLAAKATHWVLYALLAAMVTAGLALVWVRGDSIFNLFALPAYDPADPALRHRVQELHGTIGWLILGLAGIHAAAALVHRYVWRDGVLARMWPRARG